MRRVRAKSVRAVVVAAATAAVVAAAVAVAVAVAVAEVTAAVVAAVVARAGPQPGTPNSLLPSCHGGVAVGHGSVDSGIGLGTLSLFEACHAGVGAGRLFVSPNRFFPDATEKDESPVHAPGVDFLFSVVASMVDGEVPLFRSKSSCGTKERLRHWLS